MDIASVLPFDGGGVEARPARGQSPVEPFRACLGSAVGRRPRGVAPARGAETAPPAATPAGEPSAAVDELGGLGVSPELTAAPEAEAPDADGREPDQTAATLVVTAPGAELTSPEQATVALAAGVVMPPLAPPSSRGEVPPPEGEPGDSALDAPPPAPTGLGPLASPDAPPAALPLPGAVAPPVLAAAASTRTGAGAVQGQTARSSLGAERLWGYWLRHGGGGAPHTAVPFAVGTEPALDGPEGEPLRAAAAPTGGEHLWQALAAAAPAATTVAPATADPDSRAEAPLGAAVAESTAGSAALETERTPPPAPAAPREARAPQPPPQQLAYAVRVAVQRGGDRVTVQLEPESLGKVQVVLVHGEEGVRAHFRVENPLTQQALQADAPHLKQALEARGVNVLHVSVELAQGEQHPRDAAARHAPERRRRFDAGDEGDLLLEEVTLRPEQWRPWGFEARA